MIQRASQQMLNFGRVIVHREVLNELFKYFIHISRPHRPNARSRLIWGICCPISAARQPVRPSHAAVTATMNIMAAIPLLNCVNGAESMTGNAASNFSPLQSQFEAQTVDALHKAGHDKLRN